MIENKITINNRIYSLILKQTLGERVDSIPQPYVVVGRNGSGKTHLLYRLLFGIQEHEEFKPLYIEGKTLFSVNDLWRRCGTLLEIDSPAMTFEDIMTWQKRHSQRIVLLIDNIQYYFNRTDNDEHYVLRAKTYENGAPILITASASILKAFTDYNAAFYLGFKMFEIKPLSLSDMEGIAGPDIDLSRLENLMELMPKTIKSLFTALNIMKISDNAETDVRLLTDYFSSFCQYRYDEYPIQVQRILLALASVKGGANLQDIRSMTGQDSSKLSPYIKLMLDNNIIEKHSTTPRNGVYSIADPILKLWLQK